MAYERIRCNFLLLVVVIIIQVNAFTGRQPDQKCVKMNNEICRDLGYNSTLIPNVKAGIDKIDEASRRISEFSPLFRVSCYVNFKFFICNMFLPVCHTINGNPTPVYPCRHVCEEAKKGCEPLMKKYKFSWPDVLNCEFLSSVSERNALCGSPPEIKPSPKTTTEISIKTDPPAWVKVVEQVPNGIDWKTLQNKGNLDVFNKIFGLNKITVKGVCKYNPRAVYVKREEEEYCVSRCDNAAPFTTADKKFAQVWISTWSVICFLSTLLTVSTFLVDHKRFKYPERPIIFLSFCYNLYSIGYLIRVFGSYDNIVCEESKGGKHIVIDGMSVRSCSIVFFFLYFFGMASALWWVILSVTWFLSAALKWGHEAIEKYSSLFHAVSWTVPTIQTIIAFVTRKVDADTLSGVCYIGSSNSDDLLLFVVLPLLIYLLIGTLFLCMGFVALIRIRKELQRERNTNKLERLIIRIGVFVVLYSVPATIVVGCFIHEYNRLKETEDIGKDIIACLKDKDCGKDLKARTELFYLRYFMLLVVGVTSGVWIWTSKTLSSWKKFYKRHFNNSAKEEEKEKLYNKSLSSRQPQPQQQQQQQRQPRRRVSNEAINQCNTQPPTSNSHGSNPNMIQQQQNAYIQPPTRFFFPIQQHPGGFIQAHNMPVSQAKVETVSRGFTVTPTSNLASDFENNSAYNYNVQFPINPPVIDQYQNNREQFQQSRQVYSQSSMSDHQSVSHHSTTASLPRNTHIIDPPASPKSVSHYSTIEANL